MIKNIFVTGEKRCGKSTLLNRVIEEMNLEVSGFRTLPYQIESQRKGFYLKGLTETSIEMNNRPISIQDSSTSCTPITETFETLGVEVLRCSLKDNRLIIIMDELGRLEKQAEKFNQEVHRVLESNKIVLGVLQQTQVPLIESIKQRQDTAIFTLTPHNTQSVYMKIKKELERTLNYV